MTLDPHQEVPQMSTDTTPQTTPATEAGNAPAQARPAGARPSPHPRPALQPAPVPTTDKVTVSKYPASTGESESASDTAQAQENGVEVSSLQSSLHFDADTLREWMRSGWKWLKEYLTPPSVLAEPPASVAELAAYARWGAWTPRTDGPLRAFGVGWYRVVGLPVTVLCRYAEWIAQRPGRAIPVYLLWKLLISTGPGPWAATHIIRPALGVIAWVLL